MAYLFNGTTQYMECAAPAQTEPMTLFCSIYPETNTRDERPINIGIGAASTIAGFFTRLAQSGSPKAWYSIKADDNTVAYSAALAYTQSVNAWVGLTGLFGASNSRKVYADTSASTAGTTTVTSASGTYKLWLGCFIENNKVYASFQGCIACAAVWSAALTDAEIASLAKGFKPTRIRPQSLVFYAPLVRNLQDVRAGLALTNNNSATIADHPRVY